MFVHVVCKRSISMAKIVLDSSHGITSNSAKVNDLDAVLVILGEYETNCAVLVRRDEDGQGGMIRFRGADSPPKAVLYDELPPPDDTDGSSDDWLDVLDDEGDEGFVNLLRDLGPYLETPLVVQAVTIDV